MQVQTLSPIRAAVLAGLLLSLRCRAEAAELISLPDGALFYAIGALALVVAAGLGWSALLRRQEPKRAARMRLTAGELAAFETRFAQVLEAVNGTQPLPAALSQILQFLSLHLGDVPCRCELSDGSVTLAGSNAGVYAWSAGDYRCEILSPERDRLGELAVGGHARPSASWKPTSAESLEARRAAGLKIGCSLIALAIETRRLSDVLRYQSEYDSLTNVASRVQLERRLEETATHSRHAQTQFAIVYIDLDGFKQINDFHGYRIGDLYLQQISARLSGSLRSVDTLARVGGDEFAVLVPDVEGRDEAEEIANRLLRCFDSPFVIDAVTIQGSVSVGVAVSPEDGWDADQLKRAADSRRRKL
jgi:diguanylate cyclase (GGDEF)-like protein